MVWIWGNWVKIGFVKFSVAWELDLYFVCACVFQTSGWSSAVLEFNRFETLVSVILEELELALVLLDGELLWRSIQRGDSQRFSFRYGFSCSIRSSIGWDLLGVDDLVVFELDFMSLWIVSVIFSILRNFCDFCLRIELDLLSLY